MPLFDSVSSFGTSHRGSIAQLNDGTPYSPAPPAIPGLTSSHQGDPRPTVTPTTPSNSTRAPTHMERHQFNFAGVNDDVLHQQDNHAQLNAQRLAVLADDTAVHVGLNSDMRAELHKYTMADIHTQKVLVYALMLHSATIHKEFHERLDAIARDQEFIKVQVRTNYKVSRSAAAFIRKFLRYYLARAPYDYDDAAIGDVKAALWRPDSSHATKVKALGMGDYNTDEGIQSVLNAHLANEYRTQKSQLREWFMDSVDDTKKTPPKQLEQFSIFLMKKWSLDQTKTPTVAREHMVRHAIMRKHAVNALKQQREQVAKATVALAPGDKLPKSTYNTSFWAEATKDLANMYKLHGTDHRRDEAWKPVGEQLIKDDPEVVKHIMPAMGLRLEEPADERPTAQMDVDENGDPVA